MNETRKEDFLISSPRSWQDVCLLVPAVRAMVASGMGIGVLCHESARPLWATIPGVYLVPVSDKASRSELLEAVDPGWKASIAWHDHSHARAFHDAGIRKRVGLSSPAMDKWLNHPATHQPAPGEHRVRTFLSIPEQLGLATQRAEFFAPADVGVKPVPRTALLCPGSDHGPSCQWPLDRWEELAKSLLDDGWRITVADLQAKNLPGERLAKALDGRVETFIAHPLAAALPLLAVHQLTVATEGSLPHLAALAGSTCITLFGPGDPSWTRPLGVRHRVVWRKAECAPCLLAKCPLDHRCMQEITLDQVKAAIQSAL